MITDYKEFKRYIRADFKSKGKPLTLFNILKDPVLRFQVYLRFNEYLVNTKKSKILKAIPYLLFRSLSIKLGFSIPLNVFGAGLSIVHYGLLIVSPFSRIGINCRIHAGVNIGGDGSTIDKIDKTKIYAPAIGNNCYIGPGVKLYGPIKIGNNCVLGANAVVNKSFEEDSQTIAGIPAEVIAKRGSEGMLIKGASEC